MTMTDANEDIDILVEEDPKTEEVNGEIVKADEGSAPEPAKIVEPEEGLETLKAQLEAEKAERERERTGRLAAEQAAQSQAEQVAKVKGDVQDTNIQLITSALEQTKQNSEILKARYAEAMANQDFTAAADVQSEMADNSAKKAQLEYGLTALKNAPKPVAERQEIIDPVESLARLMDNSNAPRSAAWIRSHPQYATGNLNKKMIGAHEMAVADGFVADTPEYITEVERYLGLKPAESQATDDALSGASQPSQRRASPPAAPVSRNGTANGDSPRTVRLTAEEREIASLNGMTDAEYAREKLKIARSEGKVN